MPEAAAPLKLTRAHTAAARPATATMAERPKKRNSNLQLECNPFPQKTHHLPI